MDLDQLQELAALYATGALDGAERDEFQALLDGKNPAALAELERFQNAAAAFTLGLRTQSPPPHLKQKILQEIGAPIRVATPGFRVLYQADKTDWVALPVPGARIKLLSRDEPHGYAIVLGQLDPGAQYPPHKHHGPEDIYILSGDLHLGDKALRAGDFHHADPGTVHGVNYSETGCTILAVITNEDLLAQLAAAGPERS